MRWLLLKDKQLLVAVGGRDLPALGQTFTVKDVPVTVYRHDYQTWRAITREYPDAPSPIIYYGWPGRFEPRQHQLETIDFFVRYDKCFCLDDLGTGKTLSAIWAAEFLMTNNEVRRVLVIAPLSITRHVWLRELELTLPHRTAAVVCGTKQQKIEIANDTSINWVVINPDSLHVVKDSLSDVDLVIVDEFTKFKTRNTRRYKALRHIAKDRRLWLMSGTPAPQAPTDAYAPIRLVNENIIPFINFRDLTMERAGQFRWIPRENAAAIIAQYMRPAIRHARDACYDIPEVATETVNVDTTKQQENALNELYTQMRTTIDKSTITAANAAVVLGKALQILAGVVKNEDGDAVGVDTTPTMDTIERIIEQSRTPVLVFTSFRYPAKKITEHLKSCGYRAACVLGGTPDNSKIFDAVQARQLDAVVAVPGTMSHGLTLTSAATVVWITPPFSYETYMQANGRVVRQGQTHKVVIYHLVHGELDKQMFGRLETRKLLQDVVLDIIEGRI